MGASAVYGLHGLRIRSEVALVGFALRDGGCDVEVWWGDPAPVAVEAPPGRVIATCTVGERLWYVASEIGGDVMLRVPGVCDFLIDAGAGSVECRPDPGADRRVVGLLVGGLVVAFLLGLRGEAVLHASAVEVGGSAIALAGDSGAGKSTLAAVLCAEGGMLLSDDVVRLGIGPDGTVRCVGGVPQLRLRPAARWVMDRFDVPPVATATVDERLGVEPSAYTGPPPPLAAVALVRPSRTAPAVRLTEVTGAAKVLRMVAATRVAGWTDPTVLRRQFDTLVRVARSVRVVEAEVPWGPPLPDDVAPALLALATSTVNRRRPSGPLTGEHHQAVWLAQADTMPTGKEG